MALHIKLLDGIVDFTRTRRGKITISLITLFLTILILIPHAISYSVRDWMNKNGADETQVEDVNFNPFTGKLEFINLRVTVANDYTLLLNNAWVNTDWLPLFKKSLYFKEIFIQDTNITIEKKQNGKLNIGGIKLTDDNSTAQTEIVPDKKPWGLGLEQLNINNANFTYRQADLELALIIDNANLSGLYSTGNTPASFKLAGSLNGAALKIDALLMPFVKQPSIEASINLKALPLTTFSQIAQQYANINSGKLGIDIKLKARYDNTAGVHLEESGRINISELAIIQQQAIIKANTANWQGTLTTQLDTNNKPGALSLNGSIDAAGISLRNNANDSEVINIKSLTIDKLNAKPQQLEINEINIASLIAKLDRDADGNIVLPAIQQTGNNEEVEDTDRNIEEPFLFRIGRINIADNSQLSFNDVSTTPDFKSVVTLNNIDITDIDNNKPEQPTRIKLDGKIGKFSSLKASGTAHPFKDKLSLDLTTDIKAMEMPPLSAYTSSILGHNLLNGQLNSTIKVTIKEDIINGNSKLLISQLEVQELTPEEKKKINTTASAPLSLGLSMLRDRDNNIELELPFKGNVNDPELDFSDAINQAIGKAIATASLAYLKLSLQPFGALLAIADAASGIGSGVQLQPVIFDSAVSQLNPDAIQYKNKIANILNERPQLRIKVCGIATSRDRNTLIAQKLEILKKKQTKTQNTDQANKKPKLPEIPDSVLLNIAQQRADNLKGALINEHKITADRLFSCLPKIDSEPGTDPRVEVGI